jgi:hypothetical protein
VAFPQKAGPGARSVQAPELGSVSMFFVRFVTNPARKTPQKPRQHAQKWDIEDPPPSRDAKSGSICGSFSK